MGTAVKKTITLPARLSQKLEVLAKEEGKRVEEVIEEAVRVARGVQLRKTYASAQGYWSRKAREKGILTERDLRRYLGKP
jgi:hypothetical protein